MRVSEEPVFPQCRTASGGWLTVGIFKGWIEARQSFWVAASLAGVWGSCGDSDAASGKIPMISKCFHLEASRNLKSTFQNIEHWRWKKCNNHRHLYRNTDLILRPSKNDSSRDAVPLNTTKDFQATGEAFSPSDSSLDPPGYGSIVDPDPKQWIKQQVQTTDSVRFVVHISSDACPNSVYIHKYKNYKWRKQSETGLSKNQKVLMWFCSVKPWINSAYQIKEKLVWYPADIS